MTEPTRSIEITPESHPDIWAILQPPSTSVDRFPESQYIAAGVPVDLAGELGTAFRDGVSPHTGKAHIDQITENLRSHSQFGKGGQQ